MQLRQLAAIKARQHDRAARMARCRGDQPVDQTRSLDLVAPAERLDDALHVVATLAGVLDEVEIFVGSDLLDADEHGAAPCSSQSTTILCVTTSKNRHSLLRLSRRFSTTTRCSLSHLQRFRGS